MKHLKTYESWFKRKLRRDDLVEGDYIVFGESRGKIINIKILADNEPFYHIQEEDGRIRATSLYMRKERENLRYMTPEEIEDFELKLTTNNYNL